MVARTAAMWPMRGEVRGYYIFLKEAGNDNQGETHKAREEKKRGRILERGEKARIKEPEKSRSSKAKQVRCSTKIVTTSIQGLFAFTYPIVPPASLPAMVVPGRLARRLMRCQPLALPLVRPPVTGVAPLAPPFFPPPPPCAYTR